MPVPIPIHILVFIHMHLHIHGQRHIQICKGIHTSVYTHIMFVHVYTYMNTAYSVYFLGSISLCMHVVYVNMYVCMNVVPVYIHVCISTNAYTHPSTYQRAFTSLPHKARRLPLPTIEPKSSVTAPPSISRTRMGYSKAL